MAAPAAIAGDRDDDAPVFERPVPATRSVTEEPARIELDLSGIELVRPGTSEQAGRLASQTGSGESSGGGAPHDHGDLANQATNPAAALIQFRPPYPVISMLYACISPVRHASETYSWEFPRT